MWILAFLFRVAKIGFLLSLIPIALLVLLYAWQISQFAVDGRSSSFIWLYYILVLTMPIIIKNFIMGENRHARIVSCFLLPCQLILFYWLYWEVLDVATIIWVALTTVFFLLKESINFGDDVFSPLIIPYTTLVLCAFLLANTLYKEDYFFRTIIPGCQRYVDLHEIPGVPDKVKELAKSKQYFIMSNTICVTDEGQYDFKLRPTYNKYFSKTIYRIGTPAALDEMVSEIQYVTNFKGSRAKNYAISFGKGFVCNAWNSVKGLVSMVIHPIDTLTGLWRGLKDMLTSLFSSPKELITSPIKMVSGHLDEIERKIMASNNIDKDRIMLPETLQVIKEQEILYFAGEIGFDVAVVVVPLSKVRVLEKITALGSKILARFGLAKKGEELIKVSHPIIKPPKELAKELEKGVVRKVEKGGRGTELLGKKEFEKKFVETEDIEIRPETAIRGGGPNGTRRADRVLIDKRANTKTFVESKSEEEIKDFKWSWCNYQDYLFECRQKVLNKFGSCTDPAAWLIVVGCQANSNRSNQFKDDVLNYRFKNYEPRTGIHIPKQRLDEVIEALKAAGLKETNYILKEAGEGQILIELPEQSMDTISKFINH